LGEHITETVEVPSAPALRPLGPRPVLPWRPARLSPPYASSNAGKLPADRAARTAKIAGLKLCQAYRRQHGCDFVSVMPTNLYGPNDNFDLLSSRVLPALLAKLDTAVRESRDTVEIWGSGSRAASSFMSTIWPMHRLSE
jgi:GDP-L-fucose synthase